MDIEPNDLDELKEKLEERFGIRKWDRHRFFRNLLNKTAKRRTSYGIYTRNVEFRSATTHGWTEYCADDSCKYYRQKQNRLRNTYERLNQIYISDTSHRSSQK